MLTVSSDMRTNPRIQVKLFLHLFNDERTFFGTSVDLSGWGIRFKTPCPLESGDLIRISFIYKSPYVLNTRIVQEVSEHEYRGLFIFDDIVSRLSLEKNINETKKAHMTYK
ncbi:MAG: PilZ domain-containing protein [Bacillota bacterium]|nr:PilZ domain-containing protein [Bacillota bacterium]